MSSCLHIRGKVFTIILRGYLKTDINLQTMAIATGYDDNLTKFSRWRAVCSINMPELIAGWACLEQLEMEAEGACADGGFIVQAIHVSTRYVRSGWLTKRADPAFDVLFLKQNGRDEQVYSRLGVGRLYDHYLLIEVEVTEQSDIQLV
jgi:hypothetical protein